MLEIDGSEIKRLMASAFSDSLMASGGGEGVET